MPPPIDMPFTREATLHLLKLGADPEQLQYSHQQIAEWCDRFWRQYMDIDAEPDIEKLMPILADVDKEWDLHLACKYSQEELQSKDLQQERMPHEWFREWVRQIA